MNNIKKYKKGLLFFEANFLDKIINFEYEDANSATKIVGIQFKKQHFAHLCGIKYKFGAKKFFDDLKNGNVATKNIIYNDRKDLVNAKADCMDCLAMILKPGVRVCESGKFAHLEFDAALRTGRDILALAVKYQDNGFFVCNSLLNLKIFKDNQGQIKKSFQVTSVYSFDKKTRTKNIIF